MKTALVVLAALAIPLTAQAAPKHPAHQPQKLIACTQVGCLPVPQGCSPKPGKTWNGMPSGFDVMVCADGTMYGRD